LRLWAPVALGAALASEPLSASDRPAIIKAALYIITSFQFGRTNWFALKKFPCLRSMGRIRRRVPNLAHSVSEVRFLRPRSESDPERTFAPWACFEKGLVSGSKRSPHERRDMRDRGTERMRADRAPRTLAANTRS
jgi:hypothetical protein